MAAAIFAAVSVTDEEALRVIEEALDLKCFCASRVSKYCPVHNDPLAALDALRAVNADREALEDREFQTQDAEKELASDREEFEAERKDFAANRGEREKVVQELISACRAVPEAHTPATLKIALGNAQELFAPEGTPLPPPAQPPVEAISISRQQKLDALINASRDLMQQVERLLEGRTTLALGIGRVAEAQQKARAADAALQAAEVKT